MKSLFSLLLLLGGITLYSAPDIQQAVRDYASFYRKNSSGTLEQFKKCFVPGERSNIYALPLAVEKTGLGNAVIISTNKYGNVCEVKYHTGDPANIEQVVLKQQNGEWFASAFYTANQHRNLQEECAGKLQSLAKALQVFSHLNGGRFPTGNDASGWEELRQQNLIKDRSAYICPRSNEVYSYIGGKSVISNADSPLAWCNKHVENGNLSNVLLVNGKLTAMPSPATGMPPAVSPQVPAYGGGGVSLSVPQVPTYNAVPKAVPAGNKAPAHWIKGPDASWYVHYDEALAVAKRENKKILLLNVASDICPWSKRQIQEITRSEQFKKIADEHYVLLYLDNPSPSHPMPQDQREHVRQTMIKLKVSCGYPTTLIVNTNGKVEGKIAGYFAISRYLRFLERHRTSNFFGSFFQYQYTPKKVMDSPYDPLVGGRRVPANWYGGPSSSWYAHYDDALKAARRENKNILLLLTETEGCSPCKRLEEEVFKKEEFQAYAENNLILLHFCRSSSRIPLSGEQKAHIEQTLLSLGLKPRGIPFSCIISPAGKVIKTFSGFSDAESYLRRLKSIVGNRPPARRLPDFPPTVVPSGWISVASLQGKSNNRFSVGSSINGPVPENWLKGPSPEWYVRLEDAVAAARRTGKKIYALRTGVDWCPPCQTLKKEILTTNEFMQFARENLILLYIGIPRRIPIPAEQKAYNEQVYEQVKFSYPVPSIKLLDSNGNPLAVIIDYKSLPGHINVIKEALNHFR